MQKILKNNLALYFIVRHHVCRFILASGGGCILSYASIWWKGGLAAFCGIVLYLIVPAKIDN